MWETIFLVLGAIVSASLIIGGLLTMWLKPQLESVVTAIALLNNTVAHFTKSQDNLIDSVDRLENYAHNTRERVIRTEGATSAAHDRIDKIDTEISKK